MPSALERLREIRLTGPAAPVLEWTEPLAEENAKGFEGAFAYTEYTEYTELPFDPAASAVLGILVHAGHPVLHTAIVGAMASKGYDKITAKKAIASCQAKRWIEHNLVSGYVLSGMESLEDLEKSEEPENGEQI